MNIASRKRTRYTFIIKGRRSTLVGAKETIMFGLNVTCIVFGVLGLLCVVACAARELVVACRQRREAKRRYIKD